MGSLVERIAAPLLERPTARAHILWRHWHRAITPHIARHTEPVRLSDGVLTVRVDSPSWLQELTFLKPDIIARLNDAMPDARVRDIRFTQGTLKRRQLAGRETPFKQPLPPATAAEREAVEQIVAKLPAGRLRTVLSRLFLKHMQRQRRPELPAKKK
ncbi:hypothetical protein MAIT1_00301 [Magnetofaba australis IT-1]|uniref:DUF721 domain-containing protein n=1 Tax=Magnetofaba australis IT-1 TaxID=1434232 RepID=A0A1Y2K7X2_9PROT|nr:hypothetical protein MAIT1_00301 [Magnetofaba australis IT-1]